MNTEGVLRDWWGQDDVARFKGLTDMLAEQYSAFEALPGLNHFSVVESLCEPGSRLNRLARELIGASGSA